jgi:alpha-glucuronidase
MTDQEAEKLDRLILAARELGQEVEELAAESGVQFVSLAKTARHNRIMIWGVVAGGILDILLTIALGLFGFQLSSLTDQLNTTQTTQRQRALCPLYGVFLDSKSAAGRKAAPDPDKYDHAFEVIADGYRVLGCAEFLKSSGKDKW